MMPTIVALDEYFSLAARARSADIVVDIMLQLPPIMKPVSGTKINKGQPSVLSSSWKNHMIGNDNRIITSTTWDLSLSQSEITPANTLPDTAPRSYKLATIPIKFKLNPYAVPK